MKRRPANGYDPGMLIPAGNPSPWTGPTGNNTYLLDGGTPTLVDAGVGRPEHLAAIARALEGRPLAQVLLTHAHADHAAGLPALAARWPGLRVRAVAADAIEGAETLTDDEAVTAGDTPLRALATPGHAPDHCCFVVESGETAGDVYCGDLIRAGGTIVVAASRGGDLRAYLRSLQRVRALAPRRLLPGHGPAIDNPASAIDAYLQHRAEREAQVLGALQEGCRTAAAIAGRIYSGLDPSLEAAAVDTVLAHLVKLEAEGRAVRQDAGWAL